MMHEISNKESEIINPESQALIKRENSNETLVPFNDCMYKSDKSLNREYKFYFIKSTKESKTGFPILPAALNPRINNSANITNSTKSCGIPLRKLPENSESILIPGIRNFLWKCYNQADKRRRSSRVCKHKPGVKHYCRRRNWDQILSKYKTEVLDNPLIDLGTLNKTYSLNSNKKLLIDKQNATQNKAEVPLVLTRHKKRSPLQINSNNKGALSISNNSKRDITSQDVSCLSSDANSNYINLQNCNEMDDKSLFLATLGLKRIVPQKEVVNCNDLKIVNAETSNNPEEDNSANCKTEVLDNPLIDLGTLNKTYSLTSNKKLLIDKQNETQNKAEVPLVLTSHKDHSPLQINSNNKGTVSISNNSERDITSQYVSCLSSDANSNYINLQNCNEMDDKSVFLAILGLKRKLPHKVVNCNDLKIVNAETSNNAEEDNSANLVDISGDIDIETNVMDVEESTNNKLCPDMYSVSYNVENVKGNGLLEYTKDHNNCENAKEMEPSQEGKDENNTPEQNSEYLGVNTSYYESINCSKIDGNGTTENSLSSSPQDRLCHSERISSQVNSSNDTCVSLHSSVNANNFLVDNLLRNGSSNMTSYPAAHTPVSVECETRGYLSNNQEQEINNMSNHVILNLPGTIPRNPGSQTSAPWQMYSQSSAMNGVFPNFYGSPCLPTPILASQLVAPTFGYNFLPMNNVMCASHPGIMPFPNNGGYVSTSFNYASQQNVHHSLPFSFHPGQSNPLNLYHQPGFHQLVNGTSVVPWWTQSTYIGGTHLPICGGSSHALEARSQLHFSSGYYPADGYNNSFLSHPLTSDASFGNHVANVTCRRTDDVNEARSQLHFSSGYYPADGYNNSFLSHPFTSDASFGNHVANVTCRRTDDVNEVKKHN